MDKREFDTFIGTVNEIHKSVLIIDTYQQFGRDVMLLNSSSGIQNDATLVSEQYLNTENKCLFTDEDNFLVSTSLIFAYSCAIVFVSSNSKPNTQSEA